jgi:enoyl-CoA hydratase/carnithine racemase
MPALLYDRHPEGHYAIFTLNRPDQLNAQNRQMGMEFEAALQEFEVDPEMHCGVVTGAGRAFSAGADLKEMTVRNTEVAATEAAFEAGEISREERNERLAAWTRPFGSGFRLSSNPKPFIGAINGLCIAAGMERATDCDIRIASTESYFGLFEVKRGIMAAFAIEHLPRIMPYGDVLYLLLTADTISAEDAYRVGFVRELLPPDRVMPRAIEIAEMIGRNAPLAVQGSKSVASFWRRHGMEEQSRLNEWVRKHVWGSEDAKEGPRAFAEKRDAVWKGR